MDYDVNPSDVPLTIRRSTFLINTLHSNKDTCAYSLVSVIRVYVDTVDVIG